MTDPGKVGLSTQERFVLDFFRNVGSLNFAGYPADKFLDVIVRQVSDSEPSVKHAAMALTAKGHTCATGFFGDGSAKLNKFALKQTCKSIMCLMQQPTPKGILSRRAHWEVVMIMCGILTFLAINSNDIAALKMHLDYGQRAMQEWHDADFDSSSFGPTLSSVLAYSEL